MRKPVAIGMFIIALLCFWIFYDIVAVKLALLLGASRPMFHSDLTVPEDSILPRWTSNPSVSDEADSQKATLLAGTSHEVTVWANPNRLLVIVCNDVEFTLRLDRGGARAMMSDIHSTSGLRLPGDTLLAELVRRYPRVESLLARGNKGISGKQTEDAARSSER